MKKRRKKKRTKRPLPPRRFRTNRLGRLEAAPRFLREYRGKNLVRGYRRWFKVDLGCALKELQMLGADLDPEYVERLRVTTRERERFGCEPNERRRREREADDAALPHSVETEPAFEHWLDSPDDPPF